MKSRKVNQLKAHISEYEPYLNYLKKEKLNFIVKSTTYSRKIEIDDLRIHFVEDVDEPQFTLQLISKVRKEGEEYFNNNNVQDEEKIIYFFDFYYPPEKKEIYKIDLVSAYWRYALNTGVISEKTNMFFEKKFIDFNRKMQKIARLKALGSLATKKTIHTYKDGVIENTEMYRQITTPVYKEIQCGVDQFMRRLCEGFKVYMYWVDCVFCPVNVANDIVNEAKKKGFDVKTEKAMIQYVEINNNPVIVNLLDGKEYFLRESDKYVFKIAGKKDEDRIINLY